MKKAVMLMLAASTAVAALAQNDEKSINLDSVVVTGSRYATPATSLPNTVSLIGRETLTETQRLNALPTLAELVPGLTVTQRGIMGFGVSGGAAGGINMRGLSSGVGQILVLIDGHPQYQGVYGHSIADSYQTMGIDRVEVLRGPASMLYGSNAMGGVINIVTRGMHTDGVKTNVNLGGGSYGTWQAEASNQVRAGKFSSTVAGQYSKTDGHRDNMGFEQFGGYMKLAYDFSEHWNIFADGNITRFIGSHPGTVSEPMLEADQWITRANAMLGVENHYEKTSGRISVYDNFGFHKINDGYKIKGGKPQTEFFRSKDALAGVSWYQNLNLFTGSNITLGMDYNHIYGRAYYTDRETGEWVTTGKRAIQSAHTHMNEVAGYVDIRQDFTKWLTVDAGVRFDHHSVAGNEWIPQVGIVARPVNNGEIKAMVSKGFRNPSTKELYLYKVANHDSLRAERMWNYELSWKHHVADGRVTYGVNLFMMKGDNMIVNNGVQNVNTGDFKNYGAELEAAWRINSHWSLNTNHSYLHMDTPIIETPKYKGYLGATMHYSKWTANVGIQHFNGLYTAVGKDEQKENFTLLSAMVKYRLGKVASVWLKGENLLNQSYEYINGYPMPKASVMGGVNFTF